MQSAFTFRRRWIVPALTVLAALSAGWVWLSWQSDPAAVWRAELADAAERLASGDAAGAEASLAAALSATADPAMRAVAHEQMARLFLAQGALAPAREHVLAAVVELDGDPAADVALLASSVSTLAQIDRRREDWAEAAAAYRRAADLWKQAVGPDHDIVVRMLDGLGHSEFARNGYEASARAFSDSVAMQRRLAAAPSDRLGKSLNSLAEAHRLAGRSSDAEAAYREAADIFASVHGAEHPAVATTLGNLAVLYAALARNADAEALFAEAVSTLQSADATHPALAAILENYAMLMERTARPDQAQGLRERASIARGLRGDRVR